MPKCRHVRATWRGSSCAHSRIFNRQAVIRACSAFVIALPLQVDCLEKRAECVTHLSGFHNVLAAVHTLVLSHHSVTSQQSRTPPAYTEAAWEPDSKPDWVIRRSSGGSCNNAGRGRRIAKGRCWPGCSSEKSVDPHRSRSRRRRAVASQQVRPHQSHRTHPDRNSRSSEFGTRALSWHQRPSCRRCSASARPGSVPATHSSG